MLSIVAYFVLFSCYCIIWSPERYFPAVVCFTADVSFSVLFFLFISFAFFSFFHCDISKLHRLIDVKIGHVIGSMSNFIIIHVPKI